jgi:hypothetical protein
METNGNGDAKLENKVEHILINKTKLVWGIVVATTIIAGLFFKMELEVALIKENAFVHLEAQGKDIVELKAEDLRLKQENKDLMNLIISYNSKLDRLLGAHNLSIDK